MPERIDGFHEDGIKEGTCVILEHEKLGQMHVWYNKLLPFTPEDAHRQGESFYLFGGHRWPDIRVDYFVKDADGGIQYSQHSIVADAKLTKFRYLHNADGLPTNTHGQLMTYRMVSYVTNPRPVVDRVLCLYSGMGEPREPLRDIYPITFIQLMPDLYDNEVIFGYGELRETMESWLKDDIRVPLEYLQ